MSTRTPSSVLAFAVALVALGSTSLARAGDDPMAPYRERFKAGMESYTAGDLPSAISAWESIYREVGAEKGYRVAFDLARAYDKSSDLVHAGERYRSFLAVVDARRSAGVVLETVVVEEEGEARARLARIDATVDPHPLEPPPARETTQTPAPTTPAPPVPVPVPAPVPVPVPAPVPLTATRPFSPVFLFVAGGVTVAAIAVCSVEYANALSAETAFKAASTRQDLLSSYDNAQTLAYGTLGASLGLAAITGGLTVWYLAGSKTHEVSLTPVAGAIPGGAQAGLVGRW